MPFFLINDIYRCVHFRIAETMWLFESTVQLRVARISMKPFYEDYLLFISAKLALTVKRVESRVAKHLSKGCADKSKPKKRADWHLVSCKTREWGCSYVKAPLLTFEEEWLILLVMMACCCLEQKRIIKIRQTFWFPFLLISFFSLSPLLVDIWTCSYHIP